MNKLSKRKKEKPEILKKKKGNFSKFIITLVILLNIVFTSVVLYIFLEVGNEPTTLIGAFFAFTTGELWLLASIKKKKVEEENEC